MLKQLFKRWSKYLYYKSAQILIPPDLEFTTCSLMNDCGCRVNTYYCAASKCRHQVHDIRTWKWKVKGVK